MPYRPIPTFPLLLSLLFWLAPVWAVPAPGTEPAEIAAFRNDRSHGADALVERVKTWASQHTEPLPSAWAQLATGELLDELERPNDAYAALAAAAETAQREAADDLLIAVNSRLASMYANRGDAESAATVLTTMEHIAKRADRNDWMALWAYNRGVLERKLGRFPEAVALFEQSAQWARVGGDPAQQARGLNALGLVLARMGRFADALTRHNEALALANRAEDHAEIARTYRMLGFLHRNLDDEEQAAHYIREALPHLGPRDVREGIALRGELARSLIGIGQIAEAAQFGEEAARSAERLGSPPNKVNSFTALSDVRLAQGRIDEAEQWSRRAAEQFDSVAIRDRVQIHANRARVARARGDWSTALAEARNTVEGARTLGDKVLERAALDDLSDIELATGDAVAAMASRKAYQALDKALAIDIAGRRVAILEGNLAAQRAESERALLARDNQIQAMRLSRQRLLGVVMFAGLAALSVFAALLFRRYRETRRLHAELERIAHTDPLTGMPNRGALMRQFAHLLTPEAQAAPVAVLVIDIDHFKRINDQFGHLTGDVVLRDAARRMRAALPDEATFGRWGGEEFLAVLPTTTRDQALTAADAARTAVSSTPFTHDGHTLAASVSVGVGFTESPRPEDLDRLLANADTALYRAKHDGRNRVAIQ